tara:strand:- start:544 stop:1128 length:585 start_codon:yes stop_codon:yes gene_type:complete
MEQTIQNTVREAVNTFNNPNNLNMIQAAQNFRGTFNSFSIENYILFKQLFKNQKQTLTTNTNRTKEEFDIFFNNLDDNFYNWSRFFGTEAGLANFLLKNGTFIILFILLIGVFIYKVENKIKIVPNYLEVFIIVLVFSLVLFIYHRCADYHSNCKILGYSGSSIFALLLCIIILAHFFMLFKKVQDKKKEKNKV